MNRLKNDIDSAVIASALALMLAAAVQTILLFVGRLAAVPSYVQLALTTAVSMLIPLIITAAEKNRPVYNTKKQTLSFGKGLLYIFFGFSCCTGMNYAFSLLRSLFTSSSSVSKLSAASEGELLLLFAAAGVLPAVLEELLFRGRIMPMLRDGGSVFSVIVSAVLFAFIHSGIFNMLFAFCAGIILGIARIGTQRLFPCIIIHMLNNCLALGILAAGRLGQEGLSDVLFHITGISCIVIAAGLIPLLIKDIKKQAVTFNKEAPALLFKSPVFYILIVSSVIMQLL